MRSYEAARTYFSILGVVSWMVIVLGGIVALISIAAVGQMSREFGGSASAGLAGVVPGLVIAFAGFLGLVFVQIGRAGVDTAEYTQQMLKIARDQLEVSRQSLLGGASPPTTFAGLPRQTDAGQWSVSFSDAAATNGEATSEAAEKSSSGVQELIQYRGRTISKKDNRYVVEGKSFLNLSYAQKRVDELVESKA